MKQFTQNLYGWRVDVSHGNTLKVNVEHAMIMLKFAISCTIHRPETPIPSPMNLEVVLRNSQRSNVWSGASWSMERKIEIGIADLFDGPRLFQSKAFKNMPRYYHLDWTERLIGLYAHEIWHLISDSECGRPQEYEAECHEVFAIQLWRKLNNVEPSRFTHVDWGKPEPKPIHA